MYKKIVALVAAIALMWSIAPNAVLALTANDESSFSVSNPTVTVDGSTEQTVDIVFAGTEKDTYAYFQGAFDTADSTGKVTLTDMTAGYTTDLSSYVTVNTGAFKFINEDTGLETDAGVALVTATYTVAGDTPSGEYKVSVELTTSSNFDDAQVKNATYTATITVNNTSGGDTTSGYEVSLVNPSSDLVAVGGTVNLNLNVNNEFNSAKIVLSYDKDYLNYTGYTCAQTMGTGDQDVSITGEDGEITIIDYGTAFASGTAYTLNFTAKAATTSTNVSFTSAGLSTAAQANDSDLTEATTKTSASVAIGYTVTVNSVDVGTVEKDGTYTLDLSSSYDSNYTYTVTNNVGTLTDKGNGVWEITGVTENLVVTWIRAAVEYDVTWDDSTGAVSSKTGLTSEGKATYNTPITFTVAAGKNASATEAGYSYEVTVTRGTNTIAATPTVNSDNTTTYEIAGTEITGDLTIAVVKNDIPANGVTVGVSGEDVTLSAGEETGKTSVTVSKGTDVTLTLAPEPGYTYVVKVGETDITTDILDDNEYTIEDISESVTVTVIKTLDTSGVKAALYLRLDNDETQGNDLYLVYIETAEITGMTYRHGGQDFFYSAKDSTTQIGYDAYCLLVEAASADAAVAAVTAENALSLVSTTANRIAYTGDVNKTTNLDVNDAQLVWNMYNVSDVISCTADTMEKYLRADVNGDKVLNMSDAASVIDKIN